MLILDWDVHHGNGTNDIFHGTDGVLFASIHESPLYPGTGPASDVGAGRGEGYTVNLPVPRRVGRRDVGARSSSTSCVPLARAYAPELVLVSAGFDAHADDPLAGCRVTDDGLRGDGGARRGRWPRSVGAPLGDRARGRLRPRRAGAVLRGTLEVVGGATAPAAPDVPVHPLATEALARLVARWPALSGL